MTLAGTCHCCTVNLHCAWCGWPVVRRDGNHAGWCPAVDDASPLMPGHAHTERLAAMTEIRRGAITEDLLWILYGQGWPVADLAELFAVSRSTVRRRLAEA